MKIILFTLIFVVRLSNGQDVCKPASCGPSGPVVRFPFQLKDQQPDHCGYPGFELSCSQSGSTELEFLFPVKAGTNNVVIPLNMSVSVGVIDYKAQKILVTNAVARSCLPERVPTSNTSPFPFVVEGLGYDEGYTLFNCTNARDDGDPVACLSRQSYQVVAFPSVYDITTLPPHSSCFRMYNISFVPDNLYTRAGGDYSGTPFYLHWRKPECHNCERKGKYCRLRESGAEGDTECFKHGASRHNNPLPAGATVGTVLLVFIMFAVYFVLSSVKRNRDDRKRIEKALENHKHTRAMIRCSYADTKRITSNFKERLGKGSLYKGMLVDKTPVAVKMLDGSQVSVDDLIDVVDRVGGMQHDNVLQLIGYCADGLKKALIYEMLPCGVLEGIIMSSNIIDWERQHRIAVGIAKGIEYVHDADDEQIFCLNINPNNILLDQDLNPKVLVCPLSEDQEATEYTAPELLSTSVRIADQEADIYSFGMLLLKMVERGSNFERGEKEKGEVHFPERIHNQVKNEDVDWELKKIAIVGLRCIQWFPCNRPSAKEVTQMLQGDATPDVPSNPFAL